MGGWLTQELKCLYFETNYNPVSANITIAKHRSGNPIHIDRSDNGQSCKCVCYECGKSLLAIQGKSEKSREWHFRHQVESDCPGAQESALHKLAKQILQDSTRMDIPTHGKINYANCQTECGYLGRVPDVQAILDSGEVICFEIFNKHAVDETKAAFYRMNQCKSIEINLKNCPVEKYEDIVHFILKEITGKWVIFWEQQAMPAVQESAESKPKPFDWKIFAFLGILFLAVINIFSRTNTRKKRWWD